MTIQQNTLTFLKQLAKNNNREWFSKHIADYDAALTNVRNFIDALIALMNEHDDIETPLAKRSLYRIYNDVRFTTDKTPYNPRFAGYLKRRKPHLRGGYYYWIAPGRSRIGCGFAHPNGDDLKRTRIDIASNFDYWKKLLNSKPLRTTFGPMQGEQVATAHQGYSKNDPAIELLRYKQYWFEHHFTDEQVLAPNFLQQVNKTYKAIRPFFNHMSEVLSTNANGESLW